MRENIHEETFTLADLYPGDDVDTIRFRSQLGGIVKKRYFTKSKGKRPVLVDAVQNESKIRVCSYPAYIAGFNFRQHVKDSWPIEKNQK